MTSDLLRRLIEANTPVDIIADVAALIGEVSALEKRRASDRARQQSKRTEPAVSRDVTLGHVMSQGSADITPAQPAAKILPPKRPSKPRSSDYEVPDFVPPEPWAAFEAMRRRKGKPLDDYTAKKLFGRLRSIVDAGWNIEDVITKAAIGNHDGFWMPDGRDSNVRRAASAGRDRPMNVDELRAAIRFAEDHSDPERAEELKKKLRALAPTDPKVVGLVRDVSQNLRVAAQ